ncbi:YoaK family protein [Streptomyces goshikiensis]|uniref:YoaK family protein n=1 Tax=Streptomyces goshikiensis TaxID=1942 RepID=UPI00365723C3
MSYLGLGHVFVANMTGNVVFLGFALAGAQGLSAPASITALGAFLGGAFVGGRLHVRLGTHRGRAAHRRPRGTSAVGGRDVVVAAAGGDKVTSGVQYMLIVLLAMGMGVQNAVVRRLGVPDLTTTVLTLTLTGGLLLLHVGLSTALGLALLLLVATAAFTHRFSAPDAAWIRPPTS